MISIAISKSGRQPLTLQRVCGCIIPKPHTILIYGSASYPCFDKLIDRSIRVVSYSGRTASVFVKRGGRIPAPLNF